MIMEFLGIGPLKVVFILFFLLPLVLVLVVIRAFWRKMTRLETKIGELQARSSEHDDVQG
jgi:ABC-type uncharacterized transport system permease subunit